MLLQRHYDESLAQASFLLGCETSGEAIVIDPNRDVEVYMRAAASAGLRIVAVTETHIHADFLSGARELAERTGARLYLSDEGDADWKYGFAAQANATLVRGGDAIRVGRLQLDVLRTPGHTPEHIAFLLTDEAVSPEAGAIFTGDFVFVGDVGRPDLLERAANMVGTMEVGASALFASLQRLRTLPSELVLWPGHGAGSACGKNLGSAPSTTLREQLLTNWGMQCENESEFVRDVLAGQPEPPAYFKEMKRRNRDGPAILGGFREPRALAGVEIVAVVERDGLVVDVRQSQAYADGAIPGTLHVPLGRAFSTWAGSLLPYDRPVHLLASRIEDARDAVRALALIGLDQVEGWFGEDALVAWQSARGELQRTPTLTAREAFSRLAGDAITLVDVRGAAEYSAGHVPGAVHLPLGALAQRMDELPLDRPVAVHCAGGSRSPIAVSVLRRAGLTGVLDVRGGFAEHVLEGLPVQAGPR